jgi:renalase
MTSPMERNIDLLVIGAGMAGLCAAAACQKAGRNVVVIDKGRGLGGRMATRRMGDATFDHGAQFITARDPRFAALLEEARAAGAASEWCNGFAGRSDGHPRWRGTPGMTGLARFLANGLEVVQEKQVTAVRLDKDRWSVAMADGETWSARAVILTAPVPQSVKLLEDSGVTLASEMTKRLAAIEYERCLAVMAVLDGPSGLPAPGGFAPKDGPVAWIADNQLKGVSAVPAITLHATHEFSLAHWDKDREETARVLLEVAAPWLSAEVKTSQVHGWRFSRPIAVDPQPCAIISREPPLILAGDSFCGSRVEGAAVSGWAAAQVVLA